MIEKIKSLPVNKKLALFVIVVSFMLLTINLIRLDYNDINMPKLALPLSNVLLILAMMPLLFAKKVQK